MSKIIWVIINCNSRQEADKIGEALLRQRLIACFDIIPERLTAYWWPPRSGKIEKRKGSMLIGVTVAAKYKKIVIAARKLHSDKTPFIGSIKIDQANTDYHRWLENELK